MATDDMRLVREYAEHQSEQAFETLVSRYVSLVHSAAIRQVRDAQQAEEITQAVFIVLARKAGSLGARTILAAWLYRTACYVSADALKIQRRRQRREQEACLQTEIEQTTPDPAWELLSPLLDEALMRLSDKDRAAVVLHFFEKQSFAEVGRRLGTSQDSARKRANRALEKLRQFLARRGVVSTTAIIAGTISANSVQAAPVALAKSVTTVAVAKGAVVSGSTLTLIKGALKLMAWTKAKTALAAGIAVLLVGGATTVIVKKSVPGFTNSDPYETIFEKPNSYSMAQLESAPPTLIVRPTRYPNKGGGIWTPTGKGVCVNATVQDLVGIAYGMPGTRMILQDDLPAGHYDYLATLPSHQNEALQEELRKRFHIVAHRETRQTDVLLLKIRNPALLNASLTKGGGQNYYMTGDSKVQDYYFKNQPCSRLASALEGYFEKPLLDRTGATARYDWTFQWQTSNGPETLAARLERIRHTLLAQLEHVGLELVPSREPVQMLVVEKEH